MSTFFKWLASIVGAVVAGLIVYALTTNDNPVQRPHVDTPPADPCDPLPGYLSDLSILPPSWPMANAPLILEFAVRGPDAAGRIREYQWNFDGEAKSGPRVKFTLQRGTNIVSLRVTDINNCTVHRERRIVLR